MGVGRVLDDPGGMAEFHREETMGASAARNLWNGDCSVAGIVSEVLEIAKGDKNAN